MSAPEDAVGQIYINYEANLNAMLMACPDQKELIGSKLEEARTNYLACVNKAFQEGDGTLQKLVAEARASADEIKNINDHLDDVSKVVKAVTEAAAVGAEIASMVVGG